MQTYYPALAATSIPQKALKETTPYNQPENMPTQTEMLNPHLQRRLCYLLKTFSYPVLAKEEHTDQLLISSAS